MPNMIHSTAQDELAAELERLGRLDWELSPAIPQIIQAILTAKAYSDSVLMESHLHAIFEAGQGLVRDLIEKQLGRPQIAKERWRDLLETLKQCPVENYDAIGKKLEALF